MSSIEVQTGNAGIFRTSVIWHEAPKGGVTFLVIKDGAIGLATENFLADRLYQIGTGDLTQKDAWDWLMIFTSEMDAPALCYVETEDEGLGPVAVFRSGAQMGPVRYRIKI